MDTQTILMDYIKEELLKGRKMDLKPEDDLLSAGILDSLGILQMVAFIEEQFGYQVPDEDVVFENFFSVEALANYLKDNKDA
jgi:acyl carrier protein